MNYLSTRGSYDSVGSYYFSPTDTPHYGTISIEQCVCVCDVCMHESLHLLALSSLVSISLADDNKRPHRGQEDLGG